MKIVFATGNAHKLKEIQEIAKDTGIEFILPDDGFNPIENGETFEENSLIKAKEAARVSRKISLADDSGLCVDALNGAPGIHSARYAETPQARIDKLLNAINGKTVRSAKFVCAMTLVDGFGYDPIFLTKDTDYKLTMAEMSEEAKNQISHRGRALRNVLKFLETIT